MLTSNFNCVYLQVCAFPNHVQSIEFTTGGLQSSCKDISRRINGSRMHLSSISGLIAKGLNIYVDKVGKVKGSEYFPIYTFQSNIPDVAIGGCLLCIFYDDGLFNWLHLSVFIFT
jgi:hypothetical protein